MCLDFDEGPSKRTDKSIEISGFRRFEVYEEASDPWGQIFLKEGSVSAVWRGNIAIDQTCHYFAEKAGMVLRLNRDSQSLPRGLPP